MATDPAASSLTSVPVGPASTDASSMTSATVAPVAPDVENVIHRGARSRPIVPSVGLYPTNPHIDAGMRTDPPPSVVVASGANPAASAAAEPPLEPPGERSGFHGLRLAPNTLLSVNAVQPNAGVFVLPTTIAPAARKRATIVASTVAGAASENNGVPKVVGSPATSCRSLTRSGSPASGPVRRDSSNASASARRFVGAQPDDRVQLAVRSADAVERFLDELPGRHLLLAHGGGEFAQHDDEPEFGTARSLPGAATAGFGDSRRPRRS